METKMIVAQNKNKNLAPIKKMEMKATVAKSQIKLSPNYEDENKSDSIQKQNEN